MVVLVCCTGPVILHDPETGKTVQCAPDDMGQSAEVAYHRERDCIENYQRQGTNACRTEPQEDVVGSCNHVLAYIFYWHTFSRPPGRYRIRVRLAGCFHANRTRLSPSP